MLKNKNKSVNSALFVIILIALILRLSGIDHSFPFIFHPDEPTVVRSALGLRFNPNPGHFDWPHLYIYLNYFVYMAFAKFRYILIPSGPNLVTFSPWMELVFNDELIFYLLTRVLTATLGALTVIPVYLTAKELFDESKGIIAALVFAIIPFHVWHSHYSLIDVPMVFFLAWAMFYSAKITKSTAPVNYLLAGLFVGLSASTKYNGGLAALMVPVAYLVRVIKTKEPLIDFRGILHLVVSGLAAFFGFVLGTPYAIFDYKTFSRTDGPKGAFWQFTNVGSVDFPTHVNKFFSDLVFKLSDDTGYLMLIGCFFILGFVLYKFFKKRASEDTYFLTFLLIPFLFFVYYISGFEKSRSHYYMIFYPFAAVIYAYFVSLLLDLWKGKTFIFSFLTFVILIAPLLGMSALNSYKFVKNDTRVDLYKWGIKNLNPTDVVYYNSSTLDNLVKAWGVSKGKTDNLDSISQGYKIYIDADSNREVVGTISNNMRLGPNIVIAK